MDTARVGMARLLPDLYVKPPVIASFLIRCAIIFTALVAAAWARRHESLILKRGETLSGQALQLARAIGVSQPERIRILAVDRVPPCSHFIQTIGHKIGLLSSHTIGMTLRYGIYIRSDHGDDRRLLVHELAHVAQYERFGGFTAFLVSYLTECHNPGYPLGPLEQEAKRAETRFSPNR